MNVKKIALAVSLLAIFVAGTVLSAGALTPMKVSSFSREGQNLEDVFINVIERSQE